MVVKTSRKARPFIALGAIAFIGLIAAPSASIADSFTPAYPPPANSFPTNQDSTLEDVAKALGFASVAAYLLSLV